jgi:DNA-directed RNA polymerase subunit H (RpoH/RPB5)
MASVESKVRPFTAEEKILKLNTNLIEMFRIRGYKVDKEFKDLDSYRDKFKEEVEELYEKDQRTLASLLEELKKPQATLFLNRVFELDEKSKKNLPPRILVYFAKAEVKRYSANLVPEERKQISTAHIIDLTVEMDRYDVSDAILIADSTLNPNAAKRLREISKVRKVTFFQEYEILIDPNDFHYSPEFELLDEDEATRILLEADTDRNSLPPLPRSHPQVKYLGAKYPSVIKSTDTKKGLEIIKYFRIR